MIDSADNLFKSLRQREDDLIEKYHKQLSENYDLDHETKNKLFHQGLENVDELKEEMDKIKIMCIATHIMEMTRILPDEDKLVLERFCDKIMLSKYQQNQEGNQGLLKTLLEYKNKHIDLLSVKKVSSLVFKEDDEDWLRTQYKKTRQTGFREYYQHMISSALNQEALQKDNQKAMTSIEKQKNDYIRDRSGDILGAFEAEDGAQRKILLLEEAAVKDETQDFFECALDAFQNINFYNLLHWSVEEA